MPGWLSINFSNAFVFPDPEPPVINILYGWSGMYGQLGLRFFYLHLYTHQNLSFILLKVTYWLKSVSGMYTPE